MLEFKLYQQVFNTYNLTVANLTGWASVGAVILPPGVLENVNIASLAISLLL